MVPGIEFGAGDDARDFKLRPGSGRPDTEVTHDIGVRAGHNGELRAGEDACHLETGLEAGCICHGEAARSRDVPQCVDVVREFEAGGTAVPEHFLGHRVAEAQHQVRR